MVVGVVAPHGAMATEAAATRMRRAPAALAADIGPVVGYAGDDFEPVHIDAGSFWEGVALIGLAGSGKTTCLGSLFGWSLLERVSPSGKPGRPGRANTVIAIESKGEGAEGYRGWVEATGDEWALIEVADPASPVIDLFDVPRADGRPGPASAADRAEFFVNAMTYAFPTGDIQGRARETLTAVLTAALVTPPDVAAAVGLDRTASPVELAYVLAGGHGDEAGTRPGRRARPGHRPHAGRPGQVRAGGRRAGAWRSCTNRRSPPPSGAPFPSRAAPVWPTCSKPGRGGRRPGRGCRGGRSWTSTGAWWSTPVSPPPASSPASKPRS